MVGGVQKMIGQLNFVFFNWLHFFQNFFTHFNCFCYKTDMQLFGGDNTVSIARDKLTNEVYVIKVPLSNENSMKCFENECYFYKCQLEHPCILQNKHVVNRVNKKMIVLPYLRKGDLFNLVEQVPQIPEAQIRNIFKQIMDGIAFMHEQHFLHLDLKLENVLVGDDGCIKICDFGCSMNTQLSNRRSYMCGTPAYLSPGRFYGGHVFSEKDDVYSLGVMLYIMVYKQYPWPQDNDQDPQTRLDVSYTPTLYSEHLMNLIQQMLMFHETDRISVRDILLHPFCV